ncbi:MAG: hypothetical protein VCC67_01630 [Myxococcota bacterium]
MLLPTTPEDITADWLGIAWAQNQIHAGYTVVAAAPAALYGGAAVSSDLAYSAAFVEQASRAVADLESAPGIRAELGL